MPATNAQYTIVNGNNTIMVPLNKSSFQCESFGYGYGTCDEINTINLWNTNIQNWSACINYGSNYFEPDPEISIATPLFLTSYANFIWPSGPRSTNSSPVRSTK